MLTILGILGILAAGVVADAALSGQSEADDDHEPGGDQSDEVGGHLDLTDNEQATTPQSNDEVRAIEPGRELSGSNADEVLSGGEGDDFISAQGGGDLIDGRDGNDLIHAGSGRDAVWAGRGEDSVYGGEGNDSLDGQDGDDYLNGGDGNDSLTGGMGSDQIFGDAGDDTLLGGAGNDLLEGGAGKDWLAGGDDGDVILGGRGEDILDGGSGNDWLAGMSGAVDDFEMDFLNGDVGNDTIVLGAADIATGGEGADNFQISETVTHGAAPEIGDYNADEDQLVVMYDSSHHPDPQLTVKVSADGGTSTILLDGQAVAVVRGSPVDPADIRLLSNAV